MSYEIEVSEKINDAPFVKKQEIRTITRRFKLIDV